LKEYKFFKKALVALSWLVVKFMNAKEKDLVMVFLNFISLSKGFLNAEENIIQIL